MWNSCLCSTLGKHTEARLIIESVVTLSTLEESLLKIKEFKKLIIENDPKAFITIIENKETLNGYIN